MLEYYQHITIEKARNNGIQIKKIMFYDNDIYIRIWAQEEREDIPLYQAYAIFNRTPRGGIEKVPFSSADIFVIDRDDLKKVEGYCDCGTTVIYPLSAVTFEFLYPLWKF